MNLVKEKLSELTELETEDCFFFFDTIWTITEKTDLNTKALDIVGGFKKIELLNSTLVEQV